MSPKKPPRVMPASRSGSLVSDRSRARTNGGNQSEVTVAGAWTEMGYERCDPALRVGIRTAEGIARVAFGGYGGLASHQAGSNSILAGAPLGCTDPRKREATGGNGTPL